VDVLADWEGMVMVPIPTLAKNVIFITYPQSPNLLGLIKKRIVHVIMYLVRFFSARNLGKPSKEIRERVKRKKIRKLYIPHSVQRGGELGEWAYFLNTSMYSKLCTYLLLLFSGVCITSLFSVLS
jgi:hypothetical protein